MESSEARIRRMAKVGLERRRGMDRERSGQNALGEEIVNLHNENQRLRVALERLVWRNEQVRERLNKRSVSIPIWSEMCWTKALELAREVLAREERE